MHLKHAYKQISLCVLFPTHSIDIDIDFIMLQARKNQ